LSSSLAGDAAAGEPEREDAALEERERALLDAELLAERERERDFADPEGDREGDLDLDWEWERDLDLKVQQRKIINRENFRIHA
jgi:hypothetical protein